MSDCTRFEELISQPRKVMSSPIWSGIESEEVSYTAFWVNVNEGVPWRTLSGRPEMLEGQLPGSGLVVEHREVVVGLHVLGLLTQDLEVGRHRLADLPQGHQLLGFFELRGEGIRWWSRIGLSGFGEDLGSRGLRCDHHLTGELVELGLET